MRNRSYLSLVATFIVPLLLVDVAQAYFHPGTGRFISRDPYQELGGENLYCYVHNRPTIAIDAFGLQESQPTSRSCAEEIHAQPVTIDELLKMYPVFKQDYSQFGWDFSSKDILGRTHLSGCVKIPDAQGGGYFCGYMFGWKFKGNCACGNSIIQHVTKVKKWLNGGATVKEEKDSFVESFASSNEWSVKIDAHWHRGAIQPGNADQRCIWTKVVFCCGKFGDKSAPKEYEKYGDEAHKIKCEGPKKELSFNFCYDIKGGSTLGPPEPFKPKPPSTAPGGQP